MSTEEGSLIITSLWWIAKSSFFTVIGLVIGVALVVKFTAWGAQAWRIGGKFFLEKKNIFPILIFILSIIIAVTEVRMSVILSYNSNQVYTSLQNAFNYLNTNDHGKLSKAIHNFWQGIVQMVGLIGVWSIIEITKVSVSSIFPIYWRRWVNDYIVTIWLRDRTYYVSRFINNENDNHDQKIQEDVSDYVNYTYGLFFRSGYFTPGIISTVLSLIAFFPILWNLSGPVTIFNVTIPRLLTVAIIIFILLSTLVAIFIGKKLVWLDFLEQRLTANYRYALMRLRIFAAEASLYRGEVIERRILDRRFSMIIKNFWARFPRNIGLNIWQFISEQAVSPLVLILQAPRLFSGAISFGDLMQSSTAFSNVNGSLSFIRDSYSDYVVYKATLTRLCDLMNSSDLAQQLPGVHYEVAESGLQVNDLTVSTPDNKVLVNGLNFQLNPGQALVIQGQSGSGKTSLMRSLGRVWPYAQGDVKYPAESLFLSQNPYVPLGDLRTVLAYPHTPEIYSDQQYQQVMTLVQLEYLQQLLDTDQQWAQILSPGEVQRIAFARIFLAQPKIVFLDEATSALDQGLEYHLYKILREHLPETIVVSIAHREAVKIFHTYQLELASADSFTITSLAEPM